MRRTRADDHSIGGPGAAGQWVKQIIIIMETKVVGSTADDGLAGQFANAEFVRQQLPSRVSGNHMYITSRLLEHVKQSLRVNNAAGAANTHNYFFWIHVDNEFSGGT